VSPATRAGIVAVGSELLTPARVDTNSLFIADRLNQSGIDVVLKAVCGDDRLELALTLEHLLSRVELVVCCGGLGPTHDDVTREVVAEVLGLTLRQHNGLAGRIAERFAARDLSMPTINLRQAMVPEGAAILDNRFGTAPGLWITHGNHVVVLLPGPPRELRPILDGVMRDRLAPRDGGRVLVRRVVRVTGLSESHTEEVIQPLYGQWASGPVPVSVTILASLGQIEVHLSARSVDRSEAELVLAAAVHAVEDGLGADVYSSDDRTMEQVVGDLLLARDWRVGVAESCTGGLITSRLTDVSGSSRYVERSVVTYSNEAKIELLGVPPDLLAADGAVSESVAVAMAEGIRIRSGANLGIGVTGIAGPEGGSAVKPVGTVAVAVVGDGVPRSRLLRFLGEREMVKFQASQAALNLARQLLLE
jgi:nicotinamide-nucleotide amidase